MSETASHKIYTPKPEDRAQTAEEIASELQAEEANKEAPAPEYDEGVVKPDWLPEKFWDAENGVIRQEDLAKSYTELEKAKGAPEEDSTAEEAGLNIPKKEAEEAAEKAGLNFDELAAKYAEKGEIEEADYLALENSGMSREVVDNYIKGQQAIAEKYEGQLLENIGGREVFDSVAKWASDNLPADQIDAINEIIESGDVAKATVALQGLKAQYTDSTGAEPARQLEGSPSGGNGNVYGSEAEHVADMQDPRYWNDPRYRAQVDAKFNATWG